MASIRQSQRIGSYTLTDAVLVLAFGVLGGLINVTISSIWHNHFVLWGAVAPYASFFTIAPVIAMLLVRKTGVAFATAMVYSIVQAVFKLDPSFLFFGFTEGLGAELVFALFRYRRFDAMSAFLAGGIGAKTLSNLWNMAAPASAGNNGRVMMQGMMGGMSTEQYAPWQTFVGAEILALVVIGVLSGLMGWAVARLIEHTEVVERMRARLDQTPARAPQLPG